MKTPEQKLKFIMEAAGECWHRASYFSFASKGKIRCERCKSMVDYSNADRGVDPVYHSNPSPTDMNKLMELAEKLVWDYRIYFSKSAIIRKYQAEVWLDAYTREDEMVCKFADTPQEALLNALFVAKGGLEDE